jgi:hypothetical protein
MPPTDGCLIMVSLPGTIPAASGGDFRRLSNEMGVLARPKRFELLTPRFVVKKVYFYHIRCSAKLSHQTPETIAFYRDR